MMIVKQGVSMMHELYAMYVCMIDIMQICLVFSSILVIFIFSFLIFGVFILLFDHYIHLFIFMNSYVGYSHVLGSIYAWIRLGID